MTGFELRQDGVHVGHFYFVKNILGDVVGLVNEQDTLIATYEYDSWGNHRVINPTCGNAGVITVGNNVFAGNNVVTGMIGNAIVDPNHPANLNPWRWRGQYWDGAETGLYYLTEANRYYDPRSVD